MSCPRGLLPFSLMASLLACGSQPGDGQPPMQPAVRAGVTARPVPRRAAAAAPDRSRLANFDARAAEASRGSAAVRAPAFQWATRRPAPAARTSGTPPRDAVAVARSFLGLSSGSAGARASTRGGAADETVLEAVHDVGRGPVVVQFRRQVGGLDVFGQRTAVVLTRQLDVVARSGTAPSAGRIAPALRPFALDAIAAIAAALADLTGEAYGARDLVTAEAKGGFARADLAAATAAARAERLVVPARARQVLFPLAGDLVPAYRIEVALRRSGAPLQAFAYVISADDGAVLLRRDQVQQDTYDVWADPDSFLPHDGPQGLAGTPHPTGTLSGYQAAAVAQSLITVDSLPSLPDPWLPPGATTTVGNNVAAYADLEEPDGYAAATADVMGQHNGGGTFAWAYETSLEPYANAAQVQAAIAQLFYDNNVFHDWYYDSGFDEASGNAQADNLGRGGLGGDPLLAEAQDYSGTNNANMWTPGDGLSPVMQMYVFDGNGERWVEITAPASIAGKYEGQTGSFGAPSFDVTRQVVAAAPAGACSALTNGATVSGKIALVVRDELCDFVVKARRAQDAGAAGVIIRNVDASQDFGGMGGSDPTLTIPVLLVPLDRGVALNAQLASGVMARMHREAVVMRDGTLDNLIVAHEWGHYISNRLVGDGGGLESLQAGGLGEGWGDTHALLLAVREADAQVAANEGFGGVYGLSGWVSGGSAAVGGPNQGYYFGVRRVPYSTDMSKDPLTFRHIADGERLVPAGSTIPVAFDVEGLYNSEVHNTGEVWATMLWECYAALLRDTQAEPPRLTFDEARDRWKDYLVAAYKATPLNPTLLEARDALLAAAYASDRRDYTLFWQAFAKRGAGVGAVGPDKWLSIDNSPVVESFVADPHLTSASVSFEPDAAACSDGDAYLDSGEQGTLTVQLRNDGVAAVGAGTATPSAGSAPLSFPDGDVSVPGSNPGEVVTATVPVALSRSSTARKGTLVLTFPAASDLAGATVEVPLAMNQDAAAASSALEEFAAPELLWGVDGTFDGQPGWKRAGETMWAEGTSGPSDLRLVSPDLVMGTGAVTLSVRHRYLFEPEYDGGVIELSEDGGTSWQDIGGSAYDRQLFADGVNPLSGRDAFTYYNPSYPDFDTVSIPLGRTYAGRIVKIRFRSGSDETVGWGGWTIDRVMLVGLARTPFTAVRADAGQCADHSSGGGGGGGGCATGGALGWAALLAGAALALRFRRRRAR